MAGILLIGFMGAGKSTVGAKLAKILTRSFVDLDQAIETEIGMSISEYFATAGEGAFREVETAALAKALAGDDVVACGGGIVLKELNRDMLKEHPTVIYLKADPDHLYQRILQDQVNKRPLADDKTAAEVRAILQPRLPLYEEAAVIKVDTTGKTPTQIAAEILERLAEK